MPELSRRTLLIATTTLLTIPAGRAATASAAASPKASAGVGTRAPGVAAPPHEAVSGQLGSLYVTTAQGVGVDAVGIRLTLSNTGTADQTVTVTVLDAGNGKRSRTRTLRVPAGKTVGHEVFGHLNHNFMVELCLPGAICQQFGPIGGRPRGTAAVGGPRGITTAPVVPRQKTASQTG